jgi:sarcosine oxidase subunit alpha
MSRLPPQPLEWIDRSRSVSFRFEGVERRGLAGDSLTSALWAAGVRMAGRSFKYHRPRGAYSLAGHDVNVMVEDGQRTNLRGDLVPIRDGMDVRVVNTFGGLERDRLRITGLFSRFMPVGFYYKAFHTPRRLFPWYERQIRQVAGLGRLKLDAPAARTPKDYAWCDVLVVGAGPSGLSAAIAAAEQGLRVTLVDENPRPGGSFCWQHAGDESARRQLAELLARVAALPNIELRTGTQAAGWYADHWLALVDARRLTKLRATAMIVAAGCFEQPAVFGNNDLPGVMLGSAAQRLIHQYAVKPFDRCVVLAGNRDGSRVARDLRAAGVEVTMVCPGPQDERIEQWTEGIPTFFDRAAYEARPSSDKTTLAGVRLMRLAGGEPQGKQYLDLPCDGLVTTVGWAPNVGLGYQAGARFRYDATVEQFLPVSLPPGVFVAGRANGVFNLDDRLGDGRRAGLAAAAHLGHYSGELPVQPKHAGPPPSHPYPILPHAKKKNFVDLDEDLHLADFENAHQEGYDNIELLKRYTTVGMGPSQGKLANMNAVRILARLNGRSIDETGTTTSRPFHQPVSLSHLAGRRFHPLRRTAMHAWHAEQGAEFVHVGAWLRPEWYRRGDSLRDEAILTEALAVRQGVGLIDVGTLGKIQVVGPDAAEFLERIYTGRFARLPAGKSTYAMALDESGVVIDDGLVARLGDDRYYATATTTGAAALYREMQRWAIVWGLRVTLANLTGHLAAMNLAGPRSREVLAALTDVDLSPSAFPFLGVRQGQVAGVPATLMRVGFVGELGYEIHVPTGCGLHVWQALWEAGRRHGIRPFGVEAQRLLRLEKGHVIVGQDSDALTSPLEIGAEWALGKGKPFYIGQRSLQIVRRQTPTRKLVGLAWPPGYTGPLPEECHLVFHAGQIAGRVTSIARRSTLGYPLGLAFVAPELAEPGTTVRIRLDNGREVEAAVFETPFYDPAGARQKG